MHVVIALPAACRAVALRHADAPIAPRTRTNRQPSCHVADPRLLFATMALVLGLAAVTASLAPLEVEMGYPVRYRPHVGAPRDSALAPPSSSASHDLAQPPVMPERLVAAPVPEALPPASANGPWASPLYPQNGVTLWDRIRVSLKRDRGAFLLGIAIQLHAPQTAATPGPRSELPSNSSYPETTTSTLSCGELMVSPSLAMAACAAPATGERSPAPDLLRP